MTVNGTLRHLTVNAATTLLDALRWQLNLTGSKECCAEGECGACTILLDGRAANSCLVLAAEADGAEITTVEGLEGAEGLDALQEAFLQEGAVQCGFCTPGMIMASHALLRHDPHPTPAAVREGLSGNLCRCGCYPRIVKAVMRAADRRALS